MWKKDPALFPLPIMLLTFWDTTGISWSASIGDIKGRLGETKMDYTKILDGVEEGLPIAIRQSNSMGHLCGYVGVGKKHPWYKILYHQCLKGCPSEPSSIKPSMPMWYCDCPSPERLVEVHGGLTYSEMGTGKYLPRGYWWFGFDCAHAWDIVPKMGYNSPDAIYRDEKYVGAEVRKLANQLKAINDAVSKGVK